MVHSSCLCGDVTWDVGGPLQMMSHCHCSRCRKAHGAAFATHAAAPAGELRLSGRQQVTRWESSPGFFRCFCGRCGSVVPGDPWEGVVFVPAGCMEADPGARPQAHIFVGSKAPWFEIRDDLPRFEAYPPGVDAPVVPDRPPAASPRAPGGSCLCDAVAYVIEGTPLRCYSCHCSRCRKARGAAYASNLFTAAGGVRFSRGEDRLVSYKLPGAKHFMQVFCRTCGSKLPRIDRARDVAIVPMGTLDDDPGVRPASHIFVGSKAPWYEIPDELPQHAEYPPAV
jgi:hypothetical protein